jgi:hypothetical protein
MFTLVFSTSHADHFYPFVIKKHDHLLFYLMLSMTVQASQLSFFSGTFNKIQKNAITIYGIEKSSILFFSGLRHYYFHCIFCKSAHMARKGACGG